MPKLSDIVILMLLLALGLTGALASDYAWAADVCKTLAGVLLVVGIWRFKNKLRGSDYVLIDLRTFDTASFLELEHKRGESQAEAGGAAGSALTANLDAETRALLAGLVNTGHHPAKDLKPVLVKLNRRLKKLAFRFPLDPAPVAWRAWCLALLGRIEGWEKGRAMGLELPEERRWAECRQKYQAALNLAPAEPRLGNVSPDAAVGSENHPGSPHLAARIAADWGRVLENRAALPMEPGAHMAERCLKLALKEYERAAELDEDFKPAWRGLGRVLVALVMEFEAQPGLDMLKRAVECYENARGDWDWDGDFYEEFGQAVFNLAQRHPVQAVHFFRYSARLFIMSAEMNGGASLPLLQAGRALHQAGYITQENSPARAELLFKESLEYFQDADEIQPENPWSKLWSARCLTSLYQLPPDEAEPEDPDDKEALLMVAANLCSQAAALIKPREGCDPPETAGGLNGFSRHLPAEEEIFSEWANVLSLRAELDGEEAPELWAETARRYASAVGVDGVPSERAAVNWHNWGYALVSLSEYKPAEKRGRLLYQAAIKYERAAKLNGDNPVTLKNWGDVLGDLAELSEDPAEAAHLTGEAIDKFRLATELYPDDAGPWRRWSSLVQGLARAEHNPSRRRDLWQEAIDRLESGVKANPGDPDTWVMWGQVLSELYWEGPEYERPILISAISEKYERALKIEPAADSTWALLGRVHLEASDLPEEFATTMEGGALGHVVASVGCFKRACNLKPQSDDYWSEWGRALFRLAQITENEASGLAALKQAYDKYMTASALNPESGEHHTGLGHILYQWAWRLEETEDRRLKFGEAYFHCAEAGRLAPHDPIVWRNWGKVTEALANMEKDPLKSFDWQNEAEEKYYLADTLDPSGERGRRH